MGCRVIPYIRVLVVSFSLRVLYCNSSGWTNTLTNRSRNWPLVRAHAKCGLAYSKILFNSEDCTKHFTTRCKMGVRIGDPINLVSMTRGKEEGLQNALVCVNRHLQT